MHKRVLKWVYGQVQDPNVFVGEKTEAKVYIGNLDMRILELYKRNSCCILVAANVGSLEAMLSSSIVVISEEEAKLAKEKMHGRLACGRPLVVHLSSEKYSIQEAENPSRQAGNATKPSLLASSSGQMSRTSKIAAIKNKLKDLEGEGFSAAKKQKQDNTCSSDSIDHPSSQR